MRGFSFLTNVRVLTFATLLASIGGVLALMFYLHGDLFPSKKQKAAIEAVSPLAVANTLAGTDSDDDGLYDWEEQLWKTDPHNPDSDGDGTPDGVEVRGSRNPLLAGNDILEPKQNLYEGASTTSTNITSGFAKEIYSDVVALNYFNAYDDQAKKKIALRAAEQIASAATPPVPDTSRIRVTEDTSPESARRYQDAISEALLPFLKNAEHTGTGDLDVIARVVGTKDQAALAQLYQLIALYGDLVENLYDTEVPTDAHELHLELIRIMLIYRHELEGASVAGTDPLRAMVSMRSYITTLQNMSALTGQLGVYFAQKGISP